MLIRKYFWVLLLSLCLLGACKQDDALYPLKTTQTCLLISQSCKTCSHELYSYDDKGRLVSYESSSVETTVVNGDTIIDKGENRPFQYKQLFRYDAFNRIATITFYDKGVLEDSTTVYYADNTSYKPTDFSYQWTHYIQISPTYGDTALVKASYDQIGRRTNVEAFRNGEPIYQDSFVFDGQDVILATYNYEGRISRYQYEYYKDKKKQPAKCRRTHHHG